MAFVYCIDYPCEHKSNCGFQKFKTRLNVANNIKFKGFG